ncbi:MAG: IMPACT family member YigZ [Candidatus Ordinivivax streblomastigis]|uniref:IMPACT family member YigZ n=1 Tax=Candidatus Ordinivivax streblomastigis TaxID=2540710 RepID=A0A5M8P5B1_9BACT|nr:MAG: IMPACT family member YigZ [Candidatus Ordinivivax streblomastigis]
MADTFKSIKNIAEGSITEQRSKFISFAFPVQTPEAVKEWVVEYRKKYYDARHICWAYMLGAERTQFRTNDDGEPSSTAGKPILGVIHSNELTDILIIVVRYFGGVKLGTSGLILAYRAAAQDAIQNAEIIEKTVDETFTIRFAYPNLNGVMKIVKEEQVPILSQHFDTTCTMTLRIRQSVAEKLKNRLSTVDSVLFDTIFC